MLLTVLTFILTSVLILLLVLLVFWLLCLLPRYLFLLLLSLLLLFRPPPVSSPSLSLPDCCAVPGGASVAPGLATVPVSLPVPPPASATSLFCPFAADPVTSVTVPAAPLSSAFPPPPAAPDVVLGPSFSSFAPPPFLAAASSSFVAPDELPEDAPLDALPRYADSSVPESFGV